MSYRSKSGRNYSSFWSMLTEHRGRQRTWAIKNKRKKQLQMQFSGRTSDFQSDCTSSILVICSTTNPNTESIGSTPNEHEAIFYMKMQMKRGLSPQS